MIKKMCALLLCGVMISSIAACTKDGNSPSSDAVSSTNEVSSSFEVSSDLSSSSQSEYTLDQVIESLEQKTSSSDDTNSNTISLKFMARDNSLVYQYQYVNAITDVAATKTSLEEALTAEDNTFISLLKSIKSTVTDAHSVIVEYLNTDGSVIFSKEYK